MTPVTGDLSLRCRESHAPGADICVQFVLDLILLAKAGADLGPQVGDRVIAAELERDEVVDFVAAGAVRVDAIGGVDLFFDALRDVAN